MIAYCNSYMERPPFLQLKKKIEDHQFEEFKKNLKKSMTKTDYDCNFVNTFLGKFLSTQKISKDQFVAAAHMLIENMGIRGPEASFLHNLLDHPHTDNYVEDLIKLYHETNGLDKSQFGGLMFRCLEASKTTKIKPPS